jgi:hypothetical protein
MQKATIQAIRYCCLQPKIDDFVNPMKAIYLFLM